MRGGVLLCLLPLASCGTAYTERVADPERITLREAVTDVVHTMDAVRADRQGKPKVGMYLDSATVTFNLSAKRTSNETAGLTLSSVPIATSGILGANATGTLASEGLRGNQITLVFKNVATVGTTGKAAGGGNPPYVVFGQPPVILTNDQLKALEDANKKTK
ncbi:hypothetical protein [Sinorhizobium meliloti]|uniref:hypothetical protein n=1 Tax=Rhizobium meliloti TaxID=382 RepID=UPI0012A8FED6|nr:hypothetical protein [Sinorhizobium meliloti]QGJ79297.1 hypothetical protein C3L21_36710 [Sinorhizobium meliloti]